MAAAGGSWKGGVFTPASESAGQMQASKGSRGIFGNTEYFVKDGELYQARASAPIGPDGYRQGGRWEAPAHMVESRLNTIRDFAYQQQLL